MRGRSSTCGRARRLRRPGRLRAVGLRFVVAGSTLDGEEMALLESWPRLLEAEPGLAMVLAPRHPERFGAVAALLERSGIAWVRRSGWTVQSGDPEGLIRAGQIVLLDTIGELASVYSLASVAFVGGSVAEAGGHNPLEPAQFGVAIVVGPHYATFAPSPRICWPTRRFASRQKRDWPRRWSSCSTIPRKPGRWGSGHGGSSNSSRARRRAAWRRFARFFNLLRERSPRTGSRDRRIMHEITALAAAPEPRL